MTDPYVYPGTSILQNKFDIREPVLLERVERRLSLVHAREGVPKGDFDLRHLQAIHKHLFQDIYDWAGQVRTVEINKGGNQFQFRQYIETGMADVHRRLVQAKFLQGTSRAGFAEKAGEIMGDVNYVHPFREGNGRTQLLYLKQLSVNAGHKIDLRKIEQAPWMEASKSAHNHDYAPMGACILKAIEPDRVRSKDQEQER